MIRNTKFSQSEQSSNKAAQVSKSLWSRQFSSNYLERLALQFSFTQPMQSHLWNI